MINESPFHGQVLINETVSPILLYQMGKVGSKTLVESLINANIDYSIYHSHALSQTAIDAKKTIFKDGGSPEDLDMYQGIHDAILKYRDKIPWKIITLTRDPIALFISSVFETMRFSHKECMNTDGSINVEKTTETIQNSLTPENGLFRYITSWFDSELKEMFDIDVYEHKYDFNKGFKVIKDHTIEVLVIRMEDINSSFKPAMQEFLGLNNIELKKMNTAKQKNYHNEYNLVKSNLTISHDLCEKIYSSKHSRHFYTAEEISEFSKKWSTSLTLS